jgi:hypothetical protein
MKGQHNQVTELAELEHTGERAIVSEAACKESQEFTMRYKQHQRHTVL